MHVANDSMSSLSTTCSDSLVSVTVTATVVLDGELDCSTEREVTCRVARLVEVADVVRIDARRVGFIDAAGIRTLLLAKQHALENGAELTVEFSRRGPVDRLFEIVGLSACLDFGCTRSSDSGSSAPGAGLWRSVDSPLVERIDHGSRPACE